MSTESIESSNTSSTRILGEDFLNSQPSVISQGTGQNDYTEEILKDDNKEEAYINIFSQNADNISVNNNNNNNVKIESIFNKIINKLSKATMLLYYGHEVMIILTFIIISTLATLHNVAPKMTNAPLPKPFFSKGSFIYDWPYGNLIATQNYVFVSELSIVMYYAPWCAESQQARVAFETAAKLYHREIHFAAINCWHPGGECRLQFAKVPSWPVIMAYYQVGLGVQYRGTWTNPSIIRFIKSLLTPVKRLTSPGNLLQLMTRRDAVVVAFINLAVNKQNFKDYNSIAIKWIEKDPYQDLVFAIVTGETSKLFGVNELPTLRMYLWNTTLEYTGNTTWNHESINEWIMVNTQQVSLWLTPPGTKSNTLAPYLKSGPVLLLFTPRNLYLEHVDAYEMLRQLGMEYYNCNNDNWVKKMATEYIDQQRRENYNNIMKLKTECFKLTNDKKNLNKIYYLKNKCCTDKSVTISYINRLNSSKQIENEECNTIKDFCEINNIDKNNIKYCDYNLYKKHYLLNNPINYNSNPNLMDINERDSTIHKTSMLDNEHDSRSPKNLKLLTLKRNCELLDFSNSYHSALLLTDNNKSNLDLVSGLACKSNKTFAFIAIDTLMYHTFAERLGVDILNIKNKTTAIILDHDNESTYYLNKKITLKTLTEFVYNFTKGLLPRSMKSNDITYKYTHHFNYNDFMKNSYKINNNNNNTYNIKNKDNYDSNNNGYIRNKAKIIKNKIISIREITSENFNDVVINNIKTIVVFFYSSRCAFCNILSHSILTVSKILSTINNLEFVRIDGDKNDLPWHLTMEFFPSLIIFPANKKSESRIYPSNLQGNIQNVIGFVLANLSRSQRLLGIISACKIPMKILYREDCFNILRKEVTENISVNLREWRRSPHKRRKILRQLQLLQQLYLNLLKHNHSDSYYELENIIKSIIRISLSSNITS